MSMIFDKDIPSPQLMEDVLRRVNALGHEPRVVVEFDKLAYVPGLKSRFTVLDRIYDTSITHTQAGTLVTGTDDAPSTIVSGGESGDRFEYIKCSFQKQVKAYGLPNDAYYFLLAVAKHETGFGTLGQGRPEKGSFIVGYGCPGSCDPAYTGIDTQTKYACKRYAEAMKTRMSKFGLAGMTANDVDYFHEGGDKGYGKWVWSADGANWKKQVKSYYDTIRGQAMQGTSKKWECASSGGIITANKQESKCDTCDEEDIYYAPITNKMVVDMTDGGGSIPVFPVEGMDFKGDGKMASPMGWRKSTGSNHKGIDISSKSGGSAKIKGMWVVAAWDGTVQRAQFMTGFGNVVIMKHSNGFGTVYAHMQTNSIQVRAGQKIKAGTRLGKVGNTGNSYGDHLHFEVWKDQWNSLGKKGNIDPYPILTGAQKINGLMAASMGGGGSTPNEPMSVTQNVVFNKCFDKDGSISSQWISKENIKHFTALATGEKYLGFVTAKGVKDFGFKHNFSADGMYEYSFFADIKAGDLVTVTLDGITVKQYTSANNTTKPTYESPIYVQFDKSSNAGANSHIIDFTITNTSGNSVFGIKCFKVVEIETINGSQNISYTPTSRKRDVWIETGAFVFDKTFTVDVDVIDWEVNTHYDQRVGTARVTLDNKHGIYSPTYQRTTVFPDNMREAEMSHYEEGAIRHVLSEATPVRIYAGYGENLVRVFTGKIKGELEEDSTDRTITVNMVDMYDTLEEHVFDREIGYPSSEDLHGDEVDPLVLWVKSAIVHNIVEESGLTRWRIVGDDLIYPDAVLEETYYIDIDKGGKTAVVWDAKKQDYVSKKIATVKDVNGYKNPYVQSITFPEGTRASDAIQELIGEIMYRAYCDRYGTFRLENTRNLTAAGYKWEFKDGENLQSLTTAIDHSRVRNHLMILGSMGNIEHFIDKDLVVATKGNMRTAKIVAEWVDESFGATSRGIKEDMANKLFFDMKRQARTFSVVVKGNPMIEVADGCYIYDANTSNAGYYIIKGNRLMGDGKGMVNQLELTWQDNESYSVNS